MDWGRRRRWIFAPPAPLTDYIQVLGPKLRVLMRAPSGVSGNVVQATSWLDERSGARLPSGTPKPTLLSDGSNFSGKPVARFVSPGQNFQSALLPNAGINVYGGLVNVGEAPELFAVVRFVAVGNGRRIVTITDAGGAFIVNLSHNTTVIQLIQNGSVVLTTPFADTTNVHMITGRVELPSAQAFINLDGVDVASAAAAPVASACDRFFVGGIGSHIDGFVGLVGVVQSAMSPAERAEIIRIARQDFGF